MKQIQLILAGGVIAIAVYTGQFLFTDNVTIHDLNNVSIKNEKGEFISNAGSADDVAANYPHLREEVEKSSESYIKEKALEEEARNEDLESVEQTEGASVD